MVLRQKSQRHNILVNLSQPKFRMVSASASRVLQNNCSLCSQLCLILTLALSVASQLSSGVAVVGMLGIARLATPIE
jgi:hypothetical protein